MRKDERLYKENKIEEDIELKVVKELFLFVCLFFFMGVSLYLCE